jgi:PAS domain S-box-containing protein
MSDAVVITDLDGLVVDVKPAAERLTGVERSALIGHRAEFLGAPGREDELRDTIAAALTRRGRFTGLLPFRRADGSEGVAELVVVPLLDDDGEPLGSVGVSRDVSERIRTEERLRETIEELRRTDEQRRQLLTQLVAAQEEERLRIAADLHDDPIQQLYAAGLRLGMLEERLTTPDEREAVRRIGGVVDASIGRLRRMLFELQPRSLEAEGLGAALDEYVDYANQEGETLIVLHDRLTNPLSTEIRSVAYRAVLEAISNVRRHARAKKAIITIEDDGGGVACSIVDDGHGFLMSDHLDQYRPGHLGLPALRERIELAGGAFAITSAPGEGTTVTFRLPSS